jgi:hypothetical protein
MIHFCFVQFIQDKTIRARLVLVNVQLRIAMLVSSNVSLPFVFRHCLSVNSLTRCFFLYVKHRIVVRYMKKMKIIVKTAHPYLLAILYRQVASTVIIVVFMMHFTVR